MCHADAMVGSRGRRREQAHPSEDDPRPLPRTTGGLSRRRRRIGLIGCAVGLPALTGLLVVFRGELSLTSVLLVYLLAVVVIAVVGGVIPSLVAALAAFLLANWFLTPPYYTFEVGSRDQLVELLVFVVVGALVSVTVDLGARSRASAERHQLEARLLSRLTTREVGVATVAGVLDQVRGLFGMATVALAREGSGTVLASVGAACHGRAQPHRPAGEGLALVAYGPEVFAEDRRLLHTLATAAVRAYDEQLLSEKAAHALRLEETDRVRSALLAAVGHDLRTPLAGIKASVSSLRQTDVTWTPRGAGGAAACDRGVGRPPQRRDLQPARDVAYPGRRLSVHIGRVALDEVVAAALLGLGPGAERVDVPEDLPAVLADGGLLERVLANLIANARRFAPAQPPTAIEARRRGTGSVRAPRRRPRSRCAHRTGGTTCSSPSRPSGTATRAAASAWASPSPVASPRPCGSTCDRPGPRVGD